MKKTMKKTAAALCIAATLVSVAAPAMAVSPAEYMSTAALEECNTATVAQVESLINQIGTVTTARRPAIVAAVNARSEERRVGKECLRLCRSRWSPYH